MSHLVQKICEAHQKKLDSRDNICVLTRFLLECWYHLGAAPSGRRSPPPLGAAHWLQSSQPANKKNKTKHSINKMTVINTFYSPSTSPRPVGVWVDQQRAPCLKPNTPNHVISLNKRLTTMFTTRWVWPLAQSACLTIPPCDRLDAVCDVLLLPLLQNGVSRGGLAPPAHKQCVSCLTWQLSCHTEP